MYNTNYELLVKFSPASYLKGRTEIEDVWKQRAEKNIWTERGGT